MARVTLIVPSVHENLEGWIAGLQSAGHEVSVEAVRLSTKKSGPMVQRLGVRVRKLPESPRSAALRRRLPGARDKGRHWFFPERAVLAARLAGSDLVIVRTYSVPLLIAVRSVVDRRRTRLLAYEQHDARPATSWWRIRRDRQRSAAILLGSLRLKILGRFLADGAISPVTQTPIETAMGHRSVVPFAIVTYDGSTTADRRPAPMSADHELKVLMVARFEPRKRHDLAIDAVRSLRAEGVAVQLHIVGQAYGPREEAIRDAVLARVRSSGVEGCITVETNLDPETVATRYDRSDVMVLPATREPASVAVVEAAARGLPVILPRTCGTACYVQDGRTGFHIDEDAVEQLVASLRRLAEDRDLLGAMSEQAREHLAGLTDPEAVARRILQA